MEDYQLDNYNLLRLDVKIKSLNKKLSELYKAKNDIINTSDWIGYVSENSIKPILDCETNEFI